MNEVISLAKYLAASRTEFHLSEMNLYLSESCEEKQLYGILKPHFFDLDITCDAEYACRKFVKQALPADEPVIRDLGRKLKTGRLPSMIERLIESYIESHCGRTWHDGETARVIRDHIVRQKEEYWMGRSQYPKIRIISYLLYHFPVYFYQFQYVLLELLKGGVLSNKMSILDAGAGPGTVTLSTLDFLRRLFDISLKKTIDVRLNIRIDSIEQAKENIDCYNELTSRFLSTLDERASITVHEPMHTTLETADIPRDVDLIVLSNVLAEMRTPPEARAAVIERIASGSKDPTIILIEPADLVNSRALRITQRVLVKKGFTVYSPCTFIWGRSCEGVDCWSFQQPGNIQVPGFMKKIAGTGDAYRYLNTDMKFSSVILRKDERTRHAYRAKGKFVQLRNLKKHLEKRINVVTSLMSGNLGDENTSVFKVCDATATVPCYAVLPSYHITEGNSALLEAGYGDIVEIFGALIRENRAVSSYNLLITRNTVVKLVSSR